MKLLILASRTKAATPKTLRLVAGAVAALLVWSALIPSSRASLIVSEDFNYSAGELNGQSGGSGFTGAWTANTAVTEVQSGSLTFTRGDGYTYSNPGGKLELIGNADNAAQRTLSSAFSGDTFYVGFLLNVAGSLDNNDFGAGWFNNVDGIGLGLKANQGNGSGSYDVFARAKYDSSAPNAGAYHQNLTIGTTYLVVAQFSKTTSGAGNPYTTANLWVDPVYASSGTPDATLTQSGSGLSSSVSSFGFRSANLDAGDKVYYDMLRIGDTWADVVPVPESTTMIAGALLLLPFAASTLRILRKNRIA